MLQSTIQQCYFVYYSVPLSTRPLQGLILTTSTKRQELVLVIIVDP